MLPGMNPRKMQQMMKQMGIKQVEIEATEVIIKTEEKNIPIVKEYMKKAGPRLPGIVEVIVEN